MQRRVWLNSRWVWLAVLLVAGTTDHVALQAEMLNPGGSALKYEEPKQLTGTIYAREAEAPQVLFKFKRVAHRSGSTLKVQRDFTYPDGRLAARERVVYKGDALVSFELEELQIGAVGSAKLERGADPASKGSIRFAYTAEAGGRTKTRTEELAENTLIADMVGPFLQSHWEALNRGEKVRCRYIVVPRQETVGFTFVKDADSRWRGQEVVRIRMEASSRLVATLVRPLFFTLEKAPPHRVLQYTGRTTPKVRTGGKWKDLDAVTVFDWESGR